MAQRLLVVLPIAVAKYRKWSLCLTHVCVVALAFRAGHTIHRANVVAGHGGSLLRLINAVDCLDWIEQLS